MEPERAAKTSAAARGNLEFATIEAKIDVGVGNALFIRGQGGGLNWESGQPLTCVDASRWVWQRQANEKMQFKLLLNDRIWAQGEDIVAEPSSRIEVVPQFCH